MNPICLDTLLYPPKWTDSRPKYPEKKIPESSKRPEFHTKATTAIEFTSN